MSYHRRHRIDGPHTECLEAFQTCGWSTYDTSQNWRKGGGGPDFFAAKGLRTVAVEVKGAKGKLRLSQEDWHREWPGEKTVVRSGADVLAFLVRSV